MTRVNKVNQLETDKEPVTNPPRIDELFAGALTMANSICLAKAAVLILFVPNCRVDETPTLPLNNSLTTIELGGFELITEFI